MSEPVIPPSGAQPDKNVEDAANIRESVASAPNEAPKAKRKWSKGNLTSMFAQAAIGFGTAFAIKTCTAAACTALALNPVTGIVIAAVLVGLASAKIAQVMERRKAVTEDEKKNIKYSWKKAAFGIASGLVGAGLFQLWDSGFFSFGEGSTAGTDVTALNQPEQLSSAAPAEPQANAAAPAAPSATPEPATTDAPAASPAPEPAATVNAEIPAPVLSGLERIQELANGADVSDKVKAAIEKAGSSNKRVSAQAMKDLGYFLYNNLGGMPKDQGLAVEMLQKAAELGNMQAKIDLAYIEFHGNAGAGITRNVEGALEKLEALAPKSEAADRMLDHLVGPQEPLVAPHSDMPGNMPETSFPTSSGAEQVPAAGTPVLPDTAAATVLPESPAPAAPARDEAPPLTGSSPMKCLSQIYNNIVSFICTASANDTSIELGDRVILQRPALLVPVAAR